MTFENYPDLETRVKVTQGHKVVRNGTVRRSHTTSYSRSLVTLALACTVSGVQREAAVNSQFSHAHPLFRAPLRRLPVKFLSNSGVLNLESFDYHVVKTVLFCYCRFVVQIIPQRDRQTDGQIDRQSLTTIIYYRTSSRKNLACCCRPKILLE